MLQKADLLPLAFLLEHPWPQPDSCPHFASVGDEGEQPVLTFAVVFSRPPSFCPIFAFADHMLLEPWWWGWGWDIECLWGKQRAEKKTIWHEETTWLIESSFQDLDLCKGGSRNKVGPPCLSKAPSSGKKPLKNSPHWTRTWPTNKVVTTSPPTPGISYRRTILSNPILGKRMMQIERWCTRQSGSGKESVAPLLKWSAPRCSGIAVSLIISLSLSEPLGQKKGSFGEKIFWKLGPCCRDVRDSRAQRLCKSKEHPTIFERL